MSSTHKVLPCFLAVALLAGCGSSGDKPPAALTPQAPTSAPIALAPRRAAPQTVAMTANADQVAQAVERLRITKKKAEGPFEQAGADLSGDGRARALVLLTGTDWCSPQGCTLAIFEPGDVGFRPVSLITGVRVPVAAGPGSNAGWRDLLVQTGSGKTVRLQFSTGGYPANASMQPEGGADATQAEVLIQASSPVIASAPPLADPPRPQ